MTQLIASYELAIGCGYAASHPLMLLPPTGGFFLGVTHALESHYVEHRSPNRAGRSHLISERTGRCAMAAFNVGAIVNQFKEKV